MAAARYRKIDHRSGNYYLLVGLLGLMIVGGLLAFAYMEHAGHWVTGMDNQIVWGIPHVFAVFLIVAASGALNVASIASVFGKVEYKPLARLSAILALALLLGGLMVLVLDLGRPDRLLVAMTTYNFKSIFAWNIYLYSGFVLIVAIYLWFMMERRMNRYSNAIGLFAFLWRLALTTGTGCIFGFLVARQAYDAAIMAPMFVVMSFAYGLAVFILVLLASCAGSQRLIGDALLQRLRSLLGIFVAATLYFVLVYHLTNLYAAEHQGVEQFILISGGLFTELFWAAQVVAGALLPLLFIYHSAFRESQTWLLVAATLVIAGGFAQIYGIIIGGQAYPLVIFPGYNVNSSFFDGAINSYTPSLPEIALGVGGTAAALLLVFVAARVLPLLPETLVDDSAPLPGGPQPATKPG